MPALAMAAMLCIAGALGCAEIYDEVAPPETRIVSGQAQPDFVRAGETMKRVDAFIDIQGERTFVTSVDLGDGIDVIRFDTTQPCSDLVPEIGDAFQVCLTLSVSDTIEPGQRTATFELRSENELVRSEAIFFVLPALTQ